MDNLRKSAKFYSALIMGPLTIVMCFSSALFLYNLSFQYSVSFTNFFANKIWQQALEGKHSNTLHFVSKKSKKTKVNKINGVLLITGISAIGNTHNSVAHAKTAALKPNNKFGKYDKNFFTVVETNGKAKIKDANGNNVGLEFAKLTSAKIVSNCLNANIPKTEEAIMACKPKLFENQDIIQFLYNVIETHHTEKNKAMDENHHL